MIKRVSSQILSFIYKYSDLSLEIKDIYQYGCEITLSSMLNIILILLCSILLGDIMTGLVYLFIFIFLRSFTGGYHATTYFRCNLTFVVTFIFAYALYKSIIYFNIPLLVCVALALLNMIPIVIFSPVPNHHKPLTNSLKKRAYILAIVVALILLVLGILFLAFNINIGAMIITSVTMVSVLIIIEKIMQRRGLHES